VSDSLEVPTAARRSLVRYNFYFDVSCDSYVKTSCHIGLLLTFRILTNHGTLPQHLPKHCAEEGELYEVDRNHTKCSTIMLR